MYTHAQVCQTNPIQPKPTSGGGGQHTTPHPLPLPAPLDALGPAHVMLLPALISRQIALGGHVMVLAALM